MLVWVQGSPFHIAAGSHPVQEAWGSQDSLYRGQIQKLFQCCRKPYQQVPLVITTSGMPAPQAGPARCVGLYRDFTVTYMQT